MDETMGNDVHPATLHKLMRSWLLAEDPYGVNQRQEPTFDPAVAPSITEQPAPPSDPKRARNYGEKAVREELGVSGRKLPDDLKGKARGKMKAGGWSSPEESAAYAKGVGQSAVEGALAPAYSPEESAAMARGLGTSAVEGAVGGPAPAPFPLAPSFPMPMTPPGTYFGPDLETERAGGWRPGEASAAAKSLGRNAVERELRRPPSED